MAAANVTNTVLKINTPAALPTNTAIDSTDGLYITAAADQKMLIILEKITAAGDLTIKAGDGIQGVSDLTVTFSATGSQVVTVESGKYLITKGANKGKIHITGVGKAACIVLP